MLALEYPLNLISGTKMHRSIELRLVLLPLGVMMAALMYQSTNPAIYYLAAIVVYFWAYSEGEVIAGKAWSLPQRRMPGKV